MRCYPRHGNDLVAQRVHTRFAAESNGSTIRLHKIHEAWF